MYKTCDYVSRKIRKIQKRRKKRKKYKYKQIKGGGKNILNLK